MNFIVIITQSVSLFLFSGLISFHGVIGAARLSDNFHQNIEYCRCDIKYAPVCASDGYTYSNECSLTCAQINNPYLREVKKGECYPDRNRAFIRRRVCMCNSENTPVCGSDRKTYKNQCFLRCEQLNDPGLWEVKKGKCHSDRDWEIIQDSKNDTGIKTTSLCLFIAGLFFNTFLMPTLIRG